MLLLTGAVLVAADGSDKTTWFGLDPAVLVAALVGLIGGSGLLWKLIELWRSRTRFALDPLPTIDQASRVRVDILQKGTTKGFIKYLDIVSVRSTSYQLLHRIMAGPHDIRGGISVLEEPLVEGTSVALEGTEPRTFSGRVVEHTLLPVPWKPWKSLRPQAPRRRDLRVKTKWGTKPASYTRLRYEPDYSDDPMPGS
jgi:hypothetical protein